jgi:hypothetical protein
MHARAGPGSACTWARPASCATQRQRQRLSNQIAEPGSATRGDRESPGRGESYRTVSLGAGKINRPWSMASGRSCTWGRLTWNREWSFNVSISGVHHRHHHHYRPGAAGSVAQNSPTNNLPSTPAPAGPSDQSVSSSSASTTSSPSSAPAAEAAAPAPSSPGAVDKKA